MVLAVIIGYLTFLNRIRGVYFSILSQALAMILSVLLIGSQEYTGGSNGLTNFTTMFGQSLSSPAMKIRLYYAALTRPGPDLLPVQVPGEPADREDLYRHPGRREPGAFYRI